MRITKAIFFTALAILGTSFTTSATVLDFNPAEACSPACTNYDLIDQSYGDGAGVDVVYSDLSSDPTGIQYYDDWTDTTDAIFAGDEDTGSVGQIEIVALAGHMITLIGFDLVTWYSDALTTEWTIEDLLTGVISSSNGTINLLDGTNLVAAGFSSTSGFRITWGPSAYDVGLDNLSFDVVSVPESSTLALFGIGLLGMAMRRKKMG